MTKRERDALVLDLQRQKRVQESKAAVIKQMIAEHQQALTNAEKRIQEIDAGLNELS
ncbi:hypothetical protein GS454_04730 [Rhodococcus hoagii]|nr:hypothetical protein [Prescottella equi]